MNSADLLYNDLIHLHINAEQVKQWAEIQAYSRKLSCTDFLSLAEKKRAELEVCLRGLEEGTPPTVEGISQVVELLQEGSLWYPGGSKEMRVSHITVVSL